ncbi:hypothetical protein Leryth_024323, partial [Lithospermum erythrorhizon]
YGANKGIGFGICKQLISNGITVVLIKRNEEGVLKLSIQKTQGMWHHKMTWWFNLLKHLGRFCEFTISLPETSYP